jgi:ATP-dependent Lhr-like helicase
VDAGGLKSVLEKILSGEIGLSARDTPEPSVLSHELLNSAVYTFLDDAPLEERRTRAVYTRRATEPRNADDLGALDPAAIQRVREEAWPVANTADEMYDALMVAGFVLESELSPHWPDLLKALGERAVKRAGTWFAHERLDDDAVELKASRLEVLGPVTEPESPELLALEGQGRVLRGRFSSTDLQWCDRRLLARIHRYTLNRLRAEIEPVSGAEFMRFLAHWQHVATEDQVRGPDGLAAVIEQLEGFELAAAAWENDVLPARVADYEPEHIDRLCLSGRVTWGRLSAGTSAPLKSSPISLMLRAHAAPAEREIPASSVGRGRDGLRSIAYPRRSIPRGDRPAAECRGARAGRVVRSRTRHGGQLCRPASAACARRETQGAGRDGRPLGALFRLRSKAISKRSRARCSSAMA